MLSICIPIYQYDVCQLVKELQSQCFAISKTFEIICIDDFSDSVIRIKNQAIKSLNHVKYIELKENVGRSKIRNLLLKQSNYDNLIFLDCDCSIPENFIPKYFKHFDKNVVYGGRKHHINKPKDKKFSLRWKYGREREDLTIHTRKESPFLSFRSNNFMIKKTIFSLIKFDESIKTYGHEDTLLALQLKKENISIFHIENEVIHEGLENNKQFLKKTKLGIENLNNLYNSKKINPAEIKLLKLYVLISYLKFNFLLSLFSSLLMDLCLRKLNQKNPKIFWLDIYKLFYLHKLRSNSKIF